MQHWSWKCTSLQHSEAPNLLFAVPWCSKATALQAAADTNGFHTPVPYESLAAIVICLLYHVTTALPYRYSSTILMWCRCIRFLHPYFYWSTLVEETCGYSCTQVFKESLNDPNAFNSQKHSACKLLTGKCLDHQKTIFLKFGTSIICLYFIYARRTSCNR